MLLIDTILNCDNQCNDALGRHRAGLVEELKAAQKFVLEKEFALAADSLPDEEISRVVKYARPPFDTAWFEVAASYRERFASIPTEPGTFRPQRVGILVHADPDNFDQFIFNLLWSFNKYGFEHSPISMAVNLGAQFDYDNFRTKDGKHIPAGHFMRHFVPTRSIFTTIDPEATAGIYNKFFANWGGEVEFWSGVLALLSCKNATTVEAIKRSETSRRASRKTLSDYNLCRIRIPGVDSISMATPGGAAAIRLHFVRGHFKRRKSGLFWWSPFVRGDKSVGIVVKDYVIQGQGAVQ